MFTNRELATLILIAAAFVACLAIPSTRRWAAESLPGVVRTFFVWRIQVLTLGFFAWVGLCVWVAWRLHVWDWPLLKDTIITLVVLGLPLLFYTSSAKSGDVIFERVRGQAISLSAVLLFYVSLEPFPLWLELLLQVIAIVFSLVAVLPDVEERARRFASRARIFIGVVVLIWATIHVILHATSYDLVAVGKSFALSIWLPLVLFPYLYVLAFGMALEVILTRLAWFSRPSMFPFRVGLAVTVGLRLSVRLAARFNGRYNLVASAKTYREALRTMRDFRGDIRDRNAQERERLARLNRYEGVAGTDEDGAQLDRREFYATKEVLRWIATTQSGRYEGNGNRFWRDLTDMMVSLNRYDLTKDHGVTVETPRGKKKWRAWRRLPNGWVLGIGGAARGDEYVYQGSEPPISWPPDATHWTNASTSELPSDWARLDGPRV